MHITLSRVHTKHFYVFGVHNKCTWMSSVLIISKNVMFQFCFGTYILVEFMTISKCARCAQCAHCTLCAPGAQTVPQVHECAHLIVVTSKQLRVAHWVHTGAPCAQGYTKTFLMSTPILFCTKSHSTSQATAGLVAAGRLHGHQAALSAATATCRLHCTNPEHSGPLGAGPLRRARNHPP